MKLSDEDVLRRFAGVIGVGKVYGPYGPYPYKPPTSLAKKPVWLWVCRGREAKEALEALRPWLGTRRLTQAREVGFLL